MTVMLLESLVYEPVGRQNDWIFPIFPDDRAIAF